MKPIDEMEPQELRIEIAKALGWTFWRNQEEGIDFVCAPGQKPGRSVCVQIQPEQANPLEPIMYYGGVPDWPGNFAHAWSLVKYAEARDVHFQFGNVIPSSDPIVYEFILVSAAGEFYANEDTEALAICRAFLAWIWKVQA